MLLYVQLCFVYFLRITITEGVLYRNITNREWQLKHLSLGLQTPTLGEVWPKPYMEQKESKVYTLASDFVFKVIGNDCRLIQKAIQRCRDYLDTLTTLSKHFIINDEMKKEEQFTESIKEVLINLDNYCDDGYPQLGMNESYQLKIAETSELNSSSVWGIIRGMETLTQLFYLSNEFSKILIKGTVIDDRPQYAHRGLLLDTARHYIKVSDIMKTMDAMAMNKMNVLHWHLYDDQSFPYQSQFFPELSKKGAFDPSKVYTMDDIVMLVEYARDRGIRVLLETDVPGHAAAINKSHPEIFMKCNRTKRFSSPMNPIKPKTYTFLKKLLKELQFLFPDKHLHLGGDEINAGCWTHSSQIIEYIKNKGSHDFNYQFLDVFGIIPYFTSQLTSRFVKKVTRLLKNGTIPIFWEDLFNNRVKMPKESVIQCWQDAGGVIVNVLLAGFKAIQSASTNYYLDDKNLTFSHFYIHEPKIYAAKHIEDSGFADKVNLDNLIGGEACLWTDKFKHDSLLQDTIWPRASATAEVLWSFTNSTLPSNHTLQRIHEQMCRMARRGISFTFSISHCLM